MRKRTLRGYSWGLGDSWISLDHESFLPPMEGETLTEITKVQRSQFTLHLGPLSSEWTLWPQCRAQDLVGCHLQTGTDGMWTETSQPWQRN